jgi:hypothetical protein
MVVKVLGERRYELRGSTNMTLTVDINDIKPLKVPARALTRGWQISEELLDAILGPAWGRDRAQMLELDADTEMEDLQAQSWTGKMVLLRGVYWRKLDMTALHRKIQLDRPTCLVAVVPNLSCEKWFRRMDQMPGRWENSQDLAVNGLEKGALIEDADGKGVGEFAFSFWLVELSAKLM